MYAQDGPSIFPDWGLDDMIAGILTAFFAGSDTTSYATCNGLYLMLTQPELQDQLRDGGEPTIANFVEEALRVIGVTHFQGRDVIADTEIGGVAVPKGSVIMPILASANVDGAHYGCPFDVQLERPNPRDHTAFWYGPRTCGGMWLARAELLEIYTAVVERLGSLTLNPDLEQPSIHGWTTRGYWPLHARFNALPQQPAAAAGAA